MLLHGKDLVLLDAGCGVGNTLFPLLALNPHFATVHAFDVSTVATQLLQERASTPLHVFVHDIGAADIPAQQIADSSVDAVLFVFVLSAIDPARMAAVVQRVLRYERCGAASVASPVLLLADRVVCSVLKRGGIVYIRDFAVGDVAVRARALPAAAPNRASLWRSNSALWRAAIASWAARTFSVATAHLPSSSSRTSWRARGAPTTVRLSSNKTWWWSAAF